MSALVKQYAMGITLWFHAQDTGEQVRKLMCFSNVQIQMHVSDPRSLQMIYHGLGIVQLVIRVIFDSHVQKDTHQGQRINEVHVQNRM